MRVSKWGNSLAIRLPATVVKALELRDGDDIEVRIAESRVFEVTKKPGIDELLKRLRKFRGKCPEASALIATTPMSDHKIFIGSNDTTR
jgi:antitoxin MazE